MGAFHAFARLIMRFQLLATITSFIILYPIYLAAQEDSGPLILEHADKLESSGSNSDIVNLIGNVHFYHDKADLYSQKATWYQASGLVQFVDSVLVIEQGRRLTAQTVTYYRRDRRVTALHDVVLVDSVQKIELHSQRADYSRDSKQLDATGSPSLILNPSDDSSRMRIDAIKLTYFGSDSHGSAYDSVVITRHDMVAHAGQADFYRNPEKAILFKNPVIVSGQNQLSGDTISIFTENRKLNRMLVQGNAKTIYKTQPDTSLAEFTSAEIDGRQMEAFFANDKIELMVARTNATSRYAPAVTDTVVKGTNLASGDSISLFFKDSAIKRVFISGGAQGQFIEPKFSSDGKGYFDTTKYSADDINYSFDKSVIDLTGNGAMNYQDMQLSSGNIRYDTKSRILIAEGLQPDSAGKAVQPPVLKQGSEELLGDKMSYNIDTKKGQVRMARTKYESGYYSGEALRQVSSDVLLVSKGDYSSCDKEVDPHYHFFSTRMKMINKDKVVARPVVLFIGDLPVFAIPYYVFPVRKGRHSGFLPFQLGDFRNGNRFIRNLGYYWAASDYYDLQGSVDFVENQYTVFNGGMQYKLRDKFGGSLSMSYTRQGTWQNYLQHVSNRWLFSFTHSQVLDPTMTLAGSGTFMSDKNYISQYVLDPTQRLNRSIKSNMSFTKSWSSPSVGMNITASQDWNLDTDNKTELLPSFSISHSAAALFPPASKTAKKIRIRPDQVVATSENKWYNNINFGINMTGRNFRQRYRNADSTFTRKDFQIINTSSNISFNPKLFGFLNANPNIQLDHALLRLEPGRALDSLGLAPGKFVTQYAYRLGVGISTPIYGMVSPNVFGILGLRHTMTPSISYNFTPAIKKNDSYFAYSGGAVASAYRSKRLTYSLGNLFQAKYKSGDSEKKIDLFKLNTGGDYNFAAAPGTDKLGPLTTTLINSGIPKIDFTVIVKHSFYNLNGSRRPILQPRMTSMTITTGFSGSYYPGSSGGNKKDDEKDVSKPGALPTTGAATTNLGIRYSFSYNYTNSRNSGISVKDKHVNFGTEIQPTHNWNVKYDCYYDLINKLIVSQELNITRDLHCWEASIIWRPTGPVAGYYAVIRIKSMPDIKVESSRGGVGQSSPFNY